MKKLFLLLIVSYISVHSQAQSPNAKPEILYGVIQKQDLTQPPFDTWFTPGYDSYAPDKTIQKKLRKLITKEIHIQLFLGTWCGDSKREVPRLLKVLDGIGFSEKKLQLIALGGGDSLVKQSPQHEEAGKGIFRVPTVIVYRNGVELNRINEFPVTSLENDLYTILSRQSYSPNYKTFSFISSWLVNGGLLNKNISARSLAAQLRHLTEGEHELNSLAYLLAKQGMKEEALKIFQVNYLLYPESANVVSGLGEGYYKAGDVKNAIVYLEKSLELNKDPRMIKGILTVLYEAKGLK
jgi:tetratricopeptide (TPR) repeat protein